jgi:hypothetical protein
MVPNVEQCALGRKPVVPLVYSCEAYRIRY